MVAPAPPTQHPSPIPPINNHPPGVGGGGHTGPQGGKGVDIPNAMVYHPNYNKTRWRALRDKASTMRDVLKRPTGLGLILPPFPHDVSKESCPPYHIKGLRNSR